MKKETRLDKKKDKIHFWFFLMTVFENVLIF